MKNTRGKGQDGFSMIELLIVLIVVGLLAGILVPEFRNSLERAKMRGVASEVVGLMRLARLDAIKHSRDAIVVYDPAGPFSTTDSLVTRMIACPDVNGNRMCDAVPAERLLGESVLPVGVQARNERGDLGAAAIQGFTEVGAGLPWVAVFLRDGSIQNVGAFRFGDHCDNGNNVLEVRVEPAATAKIEVRKWQPNPSGYVPSGDGQQGVQGWQWYSAACTEAPGF